MQQPKFLISAHLGGPILAGATIQQSHHVLWKTVVTLSKDDPELYYASKS